MRSQSVRTLRTPRCFFKFMFQWNLSQQVRPRLKHAGEAATHRIDQSTGSRAQDKTAIRLAVFPGRRKFGSWGS